MKNFNRWMVMILILLAILPLAACGGGSEKVEPIEPAVVEEGADGFNLVTLTARAAERLGIQSEPLGEESVDGSMEVVVSYAALIYGLNGETWAYMRNSGAESLTFVRTPLTVKRIVGDKVILSDGPALGSEIVTVGVAELYGTDTGVGK